MIRVKAGAVEVQAELQPVAYRRRPSGDPAGEGQG